LERGDESDAAGSDDGRNETSFEPRRMRADGARNRQRLIDVAKQTFTELGPEISLETIARRAGVGKGTLYRHFPVRDALVEAVCRRELEQLAEAAQVLLARHAPGDALHRWMRLYVGFIATNKVMAAAVSSICGISTEPYRSSVAQITDNPLLGATTDFYRSVTRLIHEAAGLLVGEALAAGEIRADIDVANLLRAIGGFTVTYGDDVAGWEASALTLIDIFMDGLRLRQAG
jgi:AcrR family transcriptional regulator